VHAALEVAGVPVGIAKNGEALKSFAPENVLAVAFRGTSAVTISHCPGTLAQSRAPEPPVVIFPQLAAEPLVVRYPAAPVCVGTPLPPPDPPDSRVQMFVPVQPYRFWPAAAAELKNISPAEHNAGRTEPVFIGLVEGAAAKSTVLLCVLKSTAVCPGRLHAAASNNIQTLYICAPLCTRVESLPLGKAIPSHPDVNVGERRGKAVSTLNQLKKRQIFLEKITNVDLFNCDESGSIEKEEE